MFCYDSHSGYSRGNDPLCGVADMDFLEILDHVVDLLRQRGRWTCRTFKRQFNLDAKALRASALRSTSKGRC